MVNPSFPIFSPSTLLLYGVVLLVMIFISTSNIALIGLFSRFENDEDMSSDTVWKLGVDPGGVREQIPSGKLT